MKRSVRYFAILLFLNACSTGTLQGYDTYLARKHLPAPTLERFPHCHGYGCETYKNVTLNAKEWKEIDTVFKPEPKTAEEERKQIEKAIGRFETIVGPIAGTDGDIRGTFKKTGRGQHDCVDESTNTTIYLLLLKQRGLLHFHDVRGPSARFLSHGRPSWPHQTAVIEDTATGTPYAVDSWFRDNGYPAITAPLEDWQSGWNPPDSMRPEILEEKK